MTAAWLAVSAGALGRRGAWLLALGWCLALAGCAGAGPAYHGLAVPDPAAARISRSTTSADGDVLLIEVAPVKTADALATSAMMAAGDDGALRALARDRWASALPAELRAALAFALAQRLDAIDVHGPMSARLPAFRIAAELSIADFSTAGRFYGVMQWSVQGPAESPTLVGKTSLAIDIAAGADGQVMAYRRLASSAAADITVGVRSLQPPSWR